jgi:hypothetical protein
MAGTPRRIRLHIPLSALFCLVVGGRAHAQVGPNGDIDGLTAKFVDVSGVRTRYYDYGQGEAIVLLLIRRPGCTAQLSHARGHVFTILSVCCPTGGTRTPQKLANLTAFRRP